MAADVLRGVAPAKVNLALHLSGLRDDGYHLIESLVVFARFGDRLSVSASDALTLSVSGAFASGVPTDGANLVLKAAERLRSLRSVTAGATIQLEKHLPHGAGIGGGSSDAACAIGLLAKLWDVAPLNGDEALPLGADLPVCLRAPAPTIMCGIGEDLSAAPALPPLWMVLVNPGVVVPTGRMFTLHDQLYDFSLPGLDAMADFDDADGFLGWLSGQRNDLTRVACQSDVAPVIGDVLDALRAQAGCGGAEMSGSGSTCWGLFAQESAASQAAQAIEAAKPDWWVRMSALAD